MAATIIERFENLPVPERDDGGLALAPPIASDVEEVLGGFKVDADPFAPPKVKGVTASKAKVAALYSGPYYGPSDPKDRGPDKSLYVIALKRALVRWAGNTGALKWPEGGNFNATYNLALEHDVALFKKKKGIKTPGSVWGGAAHEALLAAIRGGGARKPYSPEQPALDRVAIELMEEAWDLKHPGVRDLKKVRAALAGYLEAMEANDPIWHYLQRRPTPNMGVAPSAGGRDDCSALAITAYYWCRRNTGIIVPDSTGYHYTGYGNTVSCYYTNKDRKLGLSTTFEVGDEGVYGPYASRHMVICRKRGTADTAVWTSHGSEAGPYPVRVLYRDDLWAIVRPPLLPA